MDNPTVKILHLADLHLDKPLSGGDISLPIEKLKTRQKEHRNALINALNLAESENVELILIAGDLWDEGFLREDTVPFIIDALKKIGIPVLISPGSCDPYSIISHYSQNITLGRFGLKLPHNVHVFSSEEFSHVTLPKPAYVSVSGAAVVKAGKSTQQNFRRKIVVPEMPINLGLFYGRLNNYGVEADLGFFEFNDEELLNQPFDYSALGHLHEFSTIKDSSGKIRAAYPGAAFGFDIGKSVEHGVIIVTVGPGGVNQEDIKFMETDSRRVFRIKVDITGLTKNEFIENKIDQALVSDSVRLNDIVIIELEGNFPYSHGITLSDNFIKNTCYHIEIVKNRLIPTWDKPEDNDNSPGTTSSNFLASLQEMIEITAKNGDYKEMTKLQNALYHGFCALDGKLIKPR